MKKLILIPIAALALAGCAVPTESKFNLNPLTGGVNWNNPKDTTIASLEAGISTNGTRYIKITNLSTLNNPAVITAAGAAQANSITATGTVATQMISALGAAAGTVGGTAAAAAALGKP